MPFQRIWDSSCPRVWDQFERDGRVYVIQDIPPEDDEEALKLMLDHLCPDESLCKYSDLANDQESMASIEKFWVDCLKQRMSLGCYTEVDGNRKLVAMNVCVVDSVNEPFPTTPIEGKAWKNVYDAMDIVEKKTSSFEYLKLDTLLHAYGLCVTREFRGSKLGAKLLNAREPLALSQGVKATTTVFTGPASQILAARCGFQTIAEMTLKELTEFGVDYPMIDHVIKLMVKKYVD